MHHFVVKFSKKFRLRRQGGIDTLTKILRTPFLIRFGTRQQLAKINLTPLAIGDHGISPLRYRRSATLSSLLIIDGEGLTMEAHVTNVVRNSFYQLRTVQRSLTDL